MNTYLKDIFDQPQELEKVYHHLVQNENGVLTKIAWLLRVAKKIVLSSMGSAYYSLMPMYTELKTRNKQVQLVESAELLYSPQLREKDALYILMSRSGESGEVARLAQELRRDGALSVGITMTPDSEMAKYTTIVLHDAASYDSLICTKAYTTLALCGLLCVSYMDGHALAQEQEKSLLAMFRWMEENKQGILEKYEQQAFLAQAGSYYFLSRGYGLGVVQSASLWLEETAKVPGNVQSLDNYFHGPIELTAHRAMPVFLDTFPDARSAEIWNRVRSLAEYTVCIAPEGQQDEGSLVLHYPRYEPLGDGYHMIVQALFFQLLAYQSAVARGVEPGTMDILSWVVK